jgi:phosphoserine phosphatase
MVMKKNNGFYVILLIVLISFGSCVRRKKEAPTEAGTKKDSVTTEVVLAADPLPSWNDTKSKQRIVGFINSVSTQGNADFIAPENRIATFDNDGTLWSEKPTYFQIEFILYRIKQMAPEHPEWKKDKLIQVAVNHDLQTLRKKYGAKGLGKLMVISQSGLTTDQYEKIVRNWIKKAKHPVTGKLFSKMVFQPMLELIKYLQDNNFKVYIVSGGDIDFMRAWTRDVYGISKENVIGSYQALKYEKINGKPVLQILPEISFVNDKEKKVTAIHRFIGKKPVISFGNSDGDLQMLEWCSSNKAKNLAAYIHHTDAKREWAYDRESQVGRLDKGLDEAARSGWLTVDMKKDWKVIYP